MNTFGHTEYAPFLEVDGRISYDVITPHRPLSTSLEWQEYQNYIAQYSVEKWAHLLVSYRLIRLTKRANWLKLFRLASYRDVQPNDEMISELYTKDERQSLQDYIAVQPVFVKVNDKSAKYDTDIRPLYTLDDVTVTILHSASCRNSVNRYDNMYLLLTPFIIDFAARNEYRVFVIDNRIVGISQQYCYDQLNITPAEIIAQSKKILLWWEEIKRNFLYSSAVIDIYCDQNAARLIEINSGQRWGSAGSSLFDWHVLHDSRYAGIYLAYLTIDGPKIIQIDN